MKLTKNQIYILSAIVIAVVIYFMFFRKKKTTATAKMIMPPAPTPTPSESGYYGEAWGWGTGPQDITAPEALASMSGPAGNSVAGLMESGYGANRGKGGAGYDWLTPAR